MGAGPLAAGERRARAYLSPYTGAPGARHAVRRRRARCGDQVEITVQVEPAGGIPAPVEYRWDTDTAILTAHLAETANGSGLSGSLELAGNDGSWVILDVAGGRIRSVEIAVWPDVRKRPALHPPPEVEAAIVTVPPRRTHPGVAVVQMDTALVADANPEESTIHFRLGGLREARTLRIARDVLVDVDERDTISGIWLLNVPPFPADE
jgi:hypothetical protein